MSKASEWAKAQLPEITVGNIHAYVGHRKDMRQGLAYPDPVLILATADISLAYHPFFTALVPHQALELAAWINQMFGEASA